MAKNSDVIKRVAEIYDWLEEQSKGHNSCQACGKCCDFKAYDHRLFITSPEMIYFTEKLGDDLRAMENGVCPYRIDDKCQTHQHRFIGCRIFQCKGDDDLQSRLSENAIAKIKNICTEFEVPYRYIDLVSGLNELYKQSL